MMKYKKLLDKNLIVIHKTSQQEIQELFRVSKRDIQDAQVGGLSM